MDSILAGLKAFFDTFGSTILLPVIIIILALVMGANLVGAFRVWHHRWYRLHWHWSCYRFDGQCVDQCWSSPHNKSRN